MKRMFAIFVALFAPAAFAAEITLTAVCNPGPSFDNSITVELDRSLSERLGRVEQRVVLSADRGGECSLSLCVDGSCTVANGVPASSLEGTLSVWDRFVRQAVE